MLINQWCESISTFCPTLKYQVLTPKQKEKDPEATFFIVNPINVTKFKKEFYTEMGLVIVDELHQLMSPKSLRNLFYIHPSFLIGLSATPI